MLHMKIAFWAHIEELEFFVFLECHKLLDDFRYTVYCFQRTRLQKEDPLDFARHSNSTGLGARDRISSDAAKCIPAHHGHSEESRYPKTGTESRPPRNTAAKFINQPIPPASSPPSQTENTAPFLTIAAAAPSSCRILSRRHRNSLCPD